MSCPSCGAAVGDSSKYCPSCGAEIVRATDPDTVSGRIIAKKFRVERMIGEGGMGKVYLAKQMSLDKQVVLKVLRPTLLSDERTVKRFRQEALAASRLNHPNSISVIDFGQDDDTEAMYIAMEFVQGKDLHQILSTEWPLPEARVVRIVGQVLSALADAHGAGVIHRDLKPENIMVEQRRGEPDFVKVLDFGIAKIQDSTTDREGPALTRAGFVCGTPEYMSPEQARGGTIDARSDLYAVGVILYQLTTKLLPFESDSAVGFATKHLTEDPPPPSKRAPHAKLSPGMERLILKALSKDPALRPQNAEAFRAELLNVDKERRAGANRPRPKPGQGGNVLAPLPRKATAPEEVHTQVTSEPKFGRGPATDQYTHSQATMPMSMSSLPRELRPKTDTAEVAEAGGGGALVFKVITVLLVLTAAGLGYIYFREAYRPAPEQVTYENAPVPVDHATDARLFEKQVPLDQRDAAAADQLVLEGDSAHFQGKLAEALEKYEAAFRKNPTPELSLKLGELYHLESKAEQARGWWRRHLQDNPDSKARHYIRKHYADL